MLRGSVIAAAAVLLVLAPSAHAAQEYTRTPVVVLGTEVTRPPAAPAVLGRQEEPDRIPITGGDVAGLTALGIGSLATGIALTRRARRRA